MKYITLQTAINYYMSYLAECRAENEDSCSFYDWLVYCSGYIIKDIDIYFDHIKRVIDEIK